jgi:hypothetical protein
MSFLFGFGKKKDEISFSGCPHFKNLDLDTIKNYL